eukprot:1160566-Pelagomonas_calceolata.AAC.1
MDARMQTLVVLSRKLLGMAFLGSQVRALVAVGVGPSFKQRLRLTVPNLLVVEGLELQSFSYHLALFLVAGPVFFLCLPCFSQSERTEQLNTQSEHFVLGRSYGGGGGEEEEEVEEKEEKGKEAIQQGRIALLSYKTSKCLAKTRGAAASKGLCAVRGVIGGVVVAVIVS